MGTNEIDPLDEEIDFSNMITVKGNKEIPGKVKEVKLYIGQEIYDYFDTEAKQSHVSRDWLMCMTLFDKMRVGVKAAKVNE